MIPKTVSKNVVFFDDEIEILKKIAQQKRISFSQLVREYSREGIKNEQSKESQGETEQE